MRAFAIALAAVIVSQPLTGYSGHWTAEYRGTTYVRLVLADNVGAPEGSMSIGESIHTDPQGNVDGVSEAPSMLTRMVDVHWSGAVLSFAVKDGDDVERFEFRLIDANNGELTPILTEEQRQELASDRIALPKPFRVTRAR